MVERAWSAPTLGSLWLVRHAESEGNVADLAAQDAGKDRLELTARDPDVELSHTGREQARALGEAWRDQPADVVPEIVISSPYRRALATAEIAVSGAGWHLEVRRDERLRERDLGLLDGWTRSGIERRYPEEAERRAWLGKFYYRPPGGESWADVAGRVRAVLDAVQQRYAGARLMVVSHQAVLMVFRYVLEELDEAAVLRLDESERLANTSVVRYRFEGGAAHLEAAGDTSHLDRGDAPRTEEPDAASVPQ